MRAHWTDSIAVAAVLLATSCAFADEALTPVEKRTSDTTINTDLATYSSLEGRIKALNDAGRKVSDYSLSKAQCWLDVSFTEYTTNDRSAFPEEALAQGAHLIELMEAHTSPMPTDTPLVNGASRLRPDLWDRLEVLKKDAGFGCAQQRVACAEVELVHAGNEYDQAGWRHAKAFIQIAEDYTDDATALAHACVSPPLAASLPPPPPPPPPPAVERVTLAADTLFKFNKSDLASMNPEGRAMLDQLIARIKGGYASVTHIQVNGHADRLNRHHGPDYNQKLSEKRADAVRGYLVKSGLDASLISAQGMGDQAPVVKCPDGASGEEKALEACLAPNRRVAVVITGMRKTP